MQQAGTLAALLADRCRDANFTGTAENTYIEILSQAQIIVNGALDSVIGNATLATTSYGKIYSLSANVSGALRVVGVRDPYHRDLDPIHFKDLARISRTWFRDTGDEFQAWTTAGRDLLILYPALQYASSVTVFYTTITPTLVNTTDTTVLPNEQDDITLDLAECIVLAKMRDLDAVRPALQRLVARLNAERGAERPLTLQHMLSQIDRTPAPDSES